MTKRLRLTGFARFLFVMVILVPAAYIGASYYNGEDGIQNIKNLLGIEAASSGNKAPSQRKSLDTPANSSGSTEKLEQRIADLEAENRELKVQIRDLKLELKATQLQLKNSKSNAK